MKRVITTNYEDAEERQHRIEWKTDCTSVPKEDEKVSWKSKDAYNNNREMEYNV